MGKGKGILPREDIHAIKVFRKFGNVDGLKEPRERDEYCPTKTSAFSLTGGVNIHFLLFARTTFQQPRTHPSSQSTPHSTNRRGRHPHSPRQTAIHRMPLAET